MPSSALAVAPMKGGGVPRTSPNVSCPLLSLVRDFFSWRFSDFSSTLPPTDRTCLFHLSPQLTFCPPISVVGIFVSLPI